MKRLLLISIFLAGCAAQPEQQQLGQQATLSEEQSTAQDRAKIHTELASGYYERGQLGVALEELNNALQSDSGYTPAYNMLGLVYMELREDKLAEQNFERALKLDPNNSETHNNYGSFLCRRDHIDEAIKHFLAALKNPLYATPENPYLNSGLCSLKRKDDKGAEEFFLKVLRLRPDHPQALYHLADISYRNSEYAVAKNYLTRLMQSNDAPSVESLWLRVRVEHKLGERSAEASYGLMLRQRFPGSREVQALRNGQYD